jgi:hypothetical protein
MMVSPFCTTRKESFSQHLVLFHLYRGGGENTGEALGEITLEKFFSLVSLSLLPLPFAVKG